MALVLSAILKLDGGAFTTPIGKAIEGLKFLSNVAMDVGGKLKDAFDMGGALSDLSSQNSETAGNILILQRAFADTGVGADSLGQSLAMMRKALSGVSESGEPTNKMFERLGLDMDAIKGMAATEQLETVGAAIRNLKSPTEQAAASMTVFGRSGVKLLSFLKTPDAISTAAGSLGGLPSLMDRSANAFDAISDRMSRIKEKTKGFWAGIAEGLAPMFDEVTSQLDGIDLTSIGQRIGDFIGTVIQMFRTGDWGAVVKNSLMIGIKEAGNFIVQTFMSIGKILWDILSYPIAAFSTGWSMMIEAIMKGLSKIPGINKALGLEDFQMSSISDMYKSNLEELQSYAQGGKGVKLFDASAEKAELTKAYNEASVVYQAKKRDLQASSNATGAAATGSLTMPQSDIKALKGGGGDSIATDALTRIGGMIGGAGPQSNIENLTREHVSISKAMRDLLRRMADKDSKDGMVYA
jgi:hypothetical protein